MKSILSLLSTLLTLTLPALAIPPENFGFPSAPNDTVLSVSFLQTNGTYQPLSPGSLFGINIPANPPVLGLQTSSYQSLANYTGPYVVCMVDPDASYPQMPTSRFILHWLQPNTSLVSNSTTNTNNPTALGLPSSAIQLLNTTSPFVPYRRPAPPTNSSAHRYLLYAFRQPENFTIPTAFQGYSDTNRTRFNLTNFIAAAKLGTPAAANYMYVSNQSSVPNDFVAAAGSMYPGGDGQAVTSGDPGSSMLATATGGSGSSTSSSSAGAAMITGMSGLFGAGLVGLAALL